MEYNISNYDNDVAVVGIGLRFPGKVDSPHAFWESLLNSFDGVAKVPPERWSNSFHQNQLISIENAALLEMDEWKKFDPLFFEIAPKDAPTIDPQERMLLTLAYEALEDAQIPSSSLRASNTGVFVGVSLVDYHKLQTSYSSNDPSPKILCDYIAQSVMANRISYCFDFRGPSMSIDTACSAALTSTDLAINYIQKGECDVALVCGINAIFDPETSKGFSGIGVLGEHCLPFDADANGFVRGEGCGVVVLKKRSLAERDGNRIYSVIKSRGINSDGHSNKDTITTPSNVTQTSNIESTLKRSSIDASDIYYVEAHSTGTFVGDPIEAKALIDVFGKNHTPERPLKIGSIKSNIGHLESASGIASLIKVSLMLKHRKLVPTIKLSKLNPNIPFLESNIQVVTQVEDLPNDKLILMGINSFGIGGSNSHVILQEYRVDNQNWDNNISNSDKYYLIPISGNSMISNDKYIESISQYQNRITLKEFSLCQSLTKSFHPLRKVIIAKDWDQFNEQSLVFGDQTRVNDQIKKKLIYVFCGQGPQWNQMGMNLYESEIVFKNWVDKLDSMFKEYSGYSLIEKMKLIKSDSDEMHNPIIAQPSLFIFQVALVELYKYYGLDPSIVVGHSFGDITCSYISGNIELSDAIKSVYLRASFQNETIGSGRMLVVGISSSKYQTIFENQFPNLEIACYNSDNSIVVTGSEIELNQLVNELKSSQISSQYLRTPCSFHSSNQEVIKNKVLNEINNLKSKQSTIPWYSTVTASLKTDGIDSQYIYDNIRNPVYFKKTLESIVNDIKDDFKNYIFIEISPHPTLSGLIKQSIPFATVIPTIERKKDEHLLFLSSLAKLHCLGVDINLKSQFNDVEISNPIWRDNISIIPRYQWDSDLYWTESHQSKSKRLNGPSTSILGHKSVFSQNSYLSEIDITKNPFKYLKDHQVKDRPILPGVAYVEAIIESLQSHQLDILIDSLEFIQPFFLNENGQSQKFQTSIEKQSKNQFSFEFLTKNNDYFDSSDEWLTTAKSNVILLGNSIPKNMSDSIESFRNQCNLATFTRDEIYKKTIRIGLKYGPAFRHIESISVGDGVSFAIVKVKTTSNSPSKILNSTLIDNCAHGLIHLINDRRQYFFKEIEDMEINYQSLQELESNPPEYLFLMTKLIKVEAYNAIGNCILVYPDGRFILEMKRFTASTNERFKLKKIKYPSEELNESFYQSKDSILSSPFNIVSKNLESKNLDLMESDIIKILITKVYENIPNFDLEQISKQTIEESFAMFNFIPNQVNQRIFTRIIEILNQFKEYFNLTKEELQDIKSEFDFPTIVQDISRCIQLIFETLRGGNDEYAEKLFSDGIIENVYKYEYIQNSFKKTSEIAVLSIYNSIKDINDKRVIKIVEIGGGTGTVTNILIPQLDEMLYSLGKPNIEVVYTFSDVSSFFVNPMKDKYENQYKLKSNLKLKFKVIDLDKDLVEQDLLRASYDMVLMSMVIHVCPNIREPIQNCYNILSPNGTLLFAEPGYKSIFSDLYFGGFKQFWTFNDDIRIDHCSLKPEQWDQLLSNDNRFQKPRIYEETGNHSFIIHCQKSKIKSLPINDIQRLLIVVGENQSIPVEIFQKYSNQTITIAKDNSLDIKVCNEASQIIFISSVEQQEINTYQNMLNNLVELLKMLTYQDYQPRITVVTRNCETSNYLSNSVSGLLNTAFVDHHELDLLLIDIDSELNQENINQIITLSQHKSMLGDNTYSISNNIINISRVLSINSDILEYSNAYETNSDSIKAIPNLKLDYKLRTCDVPLNDEVEIKVMASSLNFRDLGLFNQLFTPSEFYECDVLHPPYGFDVSGIVTKIGDGVKDFKIGDEVVGLTTKNGLGSITIANNLKLIQKPKQLSFNECASAPSVYLTMYFAFSKISFNPENDKVLIHRATGGIGLATLNMMRMLKCKNVYATAGSQSKIEYLKSNYSDILIDVFDSSEIGFANQIKEQSDGIDILINTLPIEFMNENFKSMAKNGRILDLITNHYKVNENLRYSNFKKDISYFVIDFGYCPSKDIRNLMTQLFDDLTSGRLEITPFKVFDATQIKDAFKLMNERKHLGKVVINYSNSQSTIVQPLIDSKKRQPLPKNDIFKLCISNTIVLIGQNGLSLELVPWLAKHTNASDIVVLSVSKLNNRMNLIINSTKSTRIQFHQIDVSDSQQLKSILQRLSNSLPPIETIFHLALILESIPINEMTPENIKKVHDPKIVGAYNLHSISIELKLPIKQFIVFSSVSGYFGEASQPSYNSASTAVDALCKYRNNTLGLRSIAIRLGPIDGEGTVANSEGIAQMFINKGQHKISLPKFFGCLEAILSQSIYCCPMFIQLSSVKTFETHPEFQHRFDHLVFGNLDKSKNSKDENVNIMDVITEGLSKLLSIPLNKLNHDTPLKNMGVDSLMHVQVKHFLDSNVGRDVFNITQIPQLTINSIHSTYQKMTNIQRKNK